MLDVWCPAWTEKGSGSTKSDLVEPLRLPMVPLGIVRDEEQVVLVVDVEERHVVHSDVCGVQLL